MPRGYRPNKNSVLYPGRLRWWNFFLLFYMCHFAMGLTHCYKTTVFFTFIYIYIYIDTSLGLWHLYIYTGSWPHGVAAYVGGNRCVFYTFLTYCKLTITQKWYASFVMFTDCGIVTSASSLTALWHRRCHNAAYSTTYFTKCILYRVVYSCAVYNVYTRRHDVRWCYSAVRRLLTEAAMRKSV